MNYELKKVALFGGTFDPIHVAHIALAESCRKQMGVDEVWFLVTPQNPWKQGSSLSPDDIRLHMVRLALADHEGLVASDYEFHLEKPTYSYLTLRHLRNDFPEHEFTLLIGGDNWAKFDHWAHYDEILQHHAVAVYPRRDCPLETPDTISALGFTPFILDAPEMPISSTEIRKRVSEGMSIEGLVPKAVERYIIDNILYS